MSTPTIRAYLHDQCGRCIFETRVHPFAPEFLEHEGKRFELLEVQPAWARYSEHLEDA